MSPRIAVNGLGRIGKLFLRAAIDGGMDAEIVFVNDAVGDPATHAHLLTFDTVQGAWDREVTADGESLLLDRRRIPVHRAGRIEDLPLADAAIDLVVDCTGVFKTTEKVRPYFDAGVERVLVSAPIHEPDALNLIYGVNDHLYDPERHRLVTATSCTTNCLAPVVKVVHEALGIRHGMMTTIHDATNTQTLVDRPAKDLRRARSALNSLIPTTTGSARAIGLVYPELEGRLNGHAVRVPLLTGSLIDCVFELSRATDTDTVNELFAAAAEAGPLAGILGYESRPLVSSDFCHDPRSAIVDGPSTMVVAGTQLKVYAWYDNEWAYACRMCDIVRRMAATS